ncbi:UDP-N-acetylmuramoyl-tripeptide--D-alanyl-D-alanine ligase [uncultured Dialister sp.]|uniref:UDP-N-acetylmuramoyl-tripeptide--D-alanyl-D- alanine ligase n=1 Tax=uncultured Dialister sp. TaxID=278064 RepID=UPI002626BA37|nr:UDP-N-acetylmuramoyl-tripeptide--D-alanyl-D-alanine ligase [uncultured Dialister sp.]
MASFTLEEIEKAASARLIHRGNIPFVDGVSTDTRTIREGELFIALTGENFNGHAFVKLAVEQGAAAVMISDASYGEGLDPKVSVFLVKDTKKGLEDTAHFHRMRFHVPVIGVTGSNGKTTTKDMITAILSTRFHVTATQKNFNNEIGLSMTLLSMTGDTEVCVVEMGMRGFGQIKELCDIASPTMGVVTNVGTSHIGILGSQDNIAKAKKELIDALPADGTAILNGDDERVSAMGKGFAGRVIRYGLHGRYTVRGSDVHYEEEDTRYTCTCFDEAFKVKLHLLGVHNVYDALAATAACRVLGVDTGKIQRALSDFRPAGQRQTVEIIDGITVLDDSYNANPLSMEMAFRSAKQMAGRHYFLVLGDMGELGRFEEKLHYETGLTAAKIGFDGLITVGPLSRFLAKGAEEGGIKAVHTCDTCEEAAERLKKMAGPGDVVLVKGSHYMHMETIPAILRGAKGKNGK